MADMDRWVTTTVDWYEAVKACTPHWTKYDARPNVSWRNHMVPAWLHNIGLVLRGKYIGTARRRIYWPRTLLAIAQNENAMRAAYRMGGATSVVELAERAMKEAGRGSG